VTHSKRALLLLSALVVAFIVQALPRVDEPFGNSHDGFNASVWALGSRELRTKGPVESKLGAQRDHNATERRYAHHPPLIYLAVAASESLFGERPAATRLPVLLSSLGAILVVFFLLSEVGVAEVPAALGLGIAFSSPMFFVYGTVLDTGMFGLFFGALLLLLWQRHRGGGDPSPVKLGAAAALSALAAWPGMLVALLVSVCSLRELRHRRQPANIAVVVGTLTGMLLVLVWALWVYGSFSDLVQIAGARSSQSEGVLGFVRGQAGNLRNLFPVSFVLLPLAFAAAVMDKKTRHVGRIAVAAVVAYAVFFRQGAAIHDYWNYWVLLPMALGTGVILQWLWSRLPRESETWAMALGIGFVASALFLSPRAPAMRAIVAGAPAGKLLSGTQAAWPAWQHLAFYQRGEAADLPMLSYYSRRLPVRLTTEQVREVCTDPGFLVLDAQGATRSWSLRRCSDPPTSPTGS
jgi:4-amino-4-deoxy-L-arabinose transferase-like glycosyltransferase